MGVGSDPADANIMGVTAAPPGLTRSCWDGRNDQLQVDYQFLKCIMCTIS